MQPPKTVLVVVPAAELRRSIEFTLEAEGLKVVSHDGFGTFFSAPEEVGFSCAIVDEDAIVGGEQSLARLAELAGPSRPVVVLLDKLPVPAGKFVFRPLPKPLLGPALIEAISDAALEAVTTTPST